METKWRIKGIINSVACAAAVPAVGPAMKKNFPEVLEYSWAFPESGVLTNDKNISYRVSGFVFYFRVSSPYGALRNPRASLRFVSA